MHRWVKKSISSKPANASLERKDGFLVKEPTIQHCGSVLSAGVSVRSDKITSDGTKVIMNHWGKKDNITFVGSNVLVITCFFFSSYKRLPEPRYFLFHQQSRLAWQVSEEKTRELLFSLLARLLSSLGSSYRAYNTSRFRYLTECN